ncbi:MAG: hypothetical protein DCC49_06940 [Acidobacteria bacterium]|nr:MAG: hypothetical protein DCC49_06940 [Acidobacteriota bacterium]
MSDGNGGPVEPGEAEDRLKTQEADVSGAEAVVRWAAQRRLWLITGGIAILIALVVLAAQVGRAPDLPQPVRIERDREAQAATRRALVDEKVIYLDRDAYTANADELTRFDKELRVGSYKDPAAVVVLTGDDGQTRCLGSQSESGKRFYIKDVTHGEDVGTYYASSGTRTDKIRRCDSGDLEAWSKDPTTGWES